MIIVTVMMIVEEENVIGVMVEKEGEKEIDGNGGGIRGGGRSS